MLVVIDFDTSVLDTSYAFDSAVSRDSDRIPEGAVVSRGVVYALRNLEKLRISYAFFTRKASDDVSFSEFVRDSILTFMPSHDFYKGFTDHVPSDCELLVSADKFLLKMEMANRTVAYIGTGSGKSHLSEPVIRMDAFSQLPCIANDIKWYQLAG